MTLEEMRAVDVRTVDRSTLTGAEIVREDRSEEEQAGKDRGLYIPDRKSILLS